MVSAPRAGLQPASSTLRTSRFYNVLLTAHGFIMVFFVVMPAVIGGFGNWFVPLMIGAPDMAFPRMNNIVLLAVDRCFAHAVAFRYLWRGRNGWTAYPPLSIDCPPWACPLISAILSLCTLLVLHRSLVRINFIATIFNMRAPGMTLHKMPLFAWAMLVTAFLLLLAVPVLAGAITCC